jgi:hypothetical protein
MSESKRLIQSDDLFQMRFLQGAALSPDGKEVVYALSYYDEESDSDKVALWLVNTETKRTRQMTAGDQQDRNSCVGSPENAVKIKRLRRVRARP